MGIGIWELLIILVIVALLFGTSKLRNIGGDLGSAIKNFRGAMKEGEDSANEAAKNAQVTNNNSVIDGQVSSKQHESR